MNENEEIKENQRFERRYRPKGYGAYHVATVKSVSGARIGYRLQGEWATRFTTKERFLKRWKLAQ